MIPCSNTCTVKVDICLTRFSFVSFRFVKRAQKESEPLQKASSQCCVFVFRVQSWPFVRETTETQCFWPGCARPMSSGGYTLETCITVQITCQATFWLYTKKGQNIVTARRVAWQKDRVMFMQPSEVVRSNTAGWGCSACQRLQLWIQHRRLSSHTSDWWDWTNPLVCNLPWLKYCVECVCSHFLTVSKSLVFTPVTRYTALHYILLIEKSQNTCKQQNWRLRFSYLLFLPTRDLAIASGWAVCFSNGMMETQITVEKC